MKFANDFVKEEKNQQLIELFLELISSDKPEVFFFFSSLLSGFEPHLIFLKKKNSFQKMK